MESGTLMAAGSAGNVGATGRVQSREGTVRKLLCHLLSFVAPPPPPGLTHQLSFFTICSTTVVLNSGESAA